MRWAQLRERLEPDLVDACERLVAERHGYSYLATVTTRGEPHLHPVAPIVLPTGLFLAVQRRSPKLHDLDANPRLALHASVTPPDDQELAVRGRASRTLDGHTRDTVVQTVRDGARLTDVMVLLEVAVHRII